MAIKCDPVGSELHGLGLSINCLGRRVTSCTTRDAQNASRHEEWEVVCGADRVSNSKLPQVRQAKLGRTNSGRSYIVKKSTYD